MNLPLLVSYYFSSHSLDFFTATQRFSFHVFPLMASLFKQSLHQFFQLSALTSHSFPFISILTSLLLSITLQTLETVHRLISDEQLSLSLQGKCHDSNRSFGFVQVAAREKRSQSGNCITGF